MKEAKIIGGIGAIFCALSPLPNLGFLFFIAGYILLLIAFKKLSHELKDYRIWNYILFALILDLFATFIIYFIFSLYLFQKLIFAHFLIPFTFSFAIIAGLITWVIAGIAGYLFFKGTKIVSEKTNENLFKISGFLMFAGGLLIIILIGALIAWIGFILLATSFFSLKSD